MKKYYIRLALIKNPRTSLQAAMRMVSHLTKKDLKDLMGNRNISNPLRVAAKRIYGEKSS